MDNGSSSSGFAAGGGSHPAPTGRPGRLLTWHRSRSRAALRRPECLDPALIADCARAALERDGITVLSYGTGGGYGPLREVLAQRHGVEPDRVYLTTGGLQGFVFYTAVQLARAAGPRARRGADLRPAAEDPRARRGPRWCRSRWTTRGSTWTRSRPSSRRAAPVSFLYTIPTFQNPSGRTIGTERRRRLVEIAAAHDLPILEDDPYGRVRYDGEPLPSIHELEGGERVTFTSSFSKTVAPGLRIGYFVVPQALVSSYDDQAVSTYISPEPAAAGHRLRAHRPRSVRAQPRSRPRPAKARKDAMLEALAAEMPAGTRWSSPEGGYFLWLDFDESVDAAALLTKATEAGVTFVRGSDFFPGASAGRSSARLAFSYESPERIREGVALLASLL